MEYIQPTGKQLLWESKRLRRLPSHVYYCNSNKKTGLLQIWQAPGGRGRKKKPTEESSNKLDMKIN